MSVFRVVTVAGCNDLQLGSGSGEVGSGDVSGVVCLRRIHPVFVLNLGPLQCVE